MCYIITGYEGLTARDLEDLRAQDVCLDDWDYMLVLPADVLHVETDEWGKPYWTTSDYDLQRLMTGCCDNTWYKIKYRGQTKALGVAYHA